MLAPCAQRMDLGRGQRHNSSGRNRRDFGLEQGLSSAGTGPPARVAQSRPNLPFGSGAHVRNAWPKSSALPGKWRRVDGPHKAGHDERAQRRPLARAAAGRRSGDAPATTSSSSAELLVAPMVATLGDELAHDVELPARLVLERRCCGGVGRNGRRRVRLDEAVERRERLHSREREWRALERGVAEVKPHRARLGDLLRFLEIALCAVPVAARAAKGCAGE